MEDLCSNLLREAAAVNACRCALPAGNIYDFYFKVITSSVRFNQFSDRVPHDDVIGNWQRDIRIAEQAGREDFTSHDYAANA